MARGYKQSDAWIVELLENEWYSPTLDIQALKARYESEARVHNCSVVSVFVTPDPLFPQCGFDSRHRVHFTSFVASEKKKLFKIEHTITVTVDNNAIDGREVPYVNTFVSGIRDQLNEMAIEKSISARYVIATGSGKVLERGRV